MLRARTAITSSVTLLSLSLLASPALAQPAAPTPATGFAIDRFNPAERGSEWFALDSLDLRGHLRPALGLGLDYASQPLVIVKESDSSERNALISNQLFLHLGGSLVLWDRLRVGVSLPVAIFQSGTSDAAEGYTVTAPSKAAVGDLRLGADLRIAGTYNDAFTLAVGAQLFLPTGSPAQFTGDGKVRVLPRLSAAGTLGLFTYAAMVGIQYRGANQGFAGKPTGTEFNGGLSAGVKVLDGHLVLGPELIASAVLDSSVKPTAALPPPVELLFGGHYSAGPLRFGVGAGPGLTQGIGAPKARVVATIDWAPGAVLDTDGDGILDPDDACVTVPGVPDPDPKKNGCPPDRDGDGILDKDDACPDVPGAPDPDPKKNGCPPDRDGDGIVDRDDACPDVHGDVNDDPRLNGCRLDSDRGTLTALDRDHDRVQNDVDKCPDVPGLKEAPPGLSADDKARWEKTFLGCPEDIDGDKIKNMEDACPFHPGPPNKDPKINGCPYAYATGCEIKITQRIYFKTQVAALETVGEKGKTTQAVLEAVLSVLKESTNIKVIEVQGHASQDTYPKNQELSDGRAASVVAWLVEHGVDSSRLRPKGYGMSRPVPGLSLDKPYKELHQRVEFHIIEGPKCDDAQPAQAQVAPASPTQVKQAPASPKPPPPVQQKQPPPVQPPAQQKQQQKQN